MRLIILQTLLGAVALSCGWLVGRPANAGAVARPDSQARTVHHSSKNNAALIPSWGRSLPAMRKIAASAADRAWIQWAWTVPDDDIHQAVKLLDPRIHFAALDTLFCRWVKLDLSAAWDAFSRMAIPGTAHSMELREFGEFHGCVVLRPGFEGYTEQFYPRCSISSHMGKSALAADPARWLAYLETFSDPKESELINHGFEMVDEAGLPQYSLLGTLIIDAEREIAHAHQPSMTPAEATKQASKMESPYLEVLRNFRKWMKEDSASALAWVESGTGLEAERRVSYAMDAIPDTLLPEAQIGMVLEVIRSRKQEEAPPFMDPAFSKACMTLVQWSRDEPAAAISFLESMPVGELRNSAAGLSADELVRSDPEAAIALLGKLGRDIKTALSDLAYGWARHDATACTERLLQNNDSNISSEGLGSVAGILSDHSPMDALEAALRISDDSKRTRMLEEIQTSFRWNPALKRQAMAKHPGLGW